MLTNHIMEDLRLKDYRGTLEKLITFTILDY